MLLSHCLADAKVLAVDLQKRELTGAATKAWQKCGRTLNNFTCVEGELVKEGENWFKSLQKDCGHKAEDKSSLVVAVHACNEALLDVLTLAKNMQSPWVVVPCCLRKKLYLPSLSSHLSHDHHYPVMCGSLSVKFGASMVRSIDPVITPKNIILAGGLDKVSRH
eukprot:TRINITY_DN34178_c0_g1_i1.p1 TRINITY_DN34178_c0_g1~~TRINITY_DN34178_c0_g1_i1.p1  ORF type:complete len:164 (+),score=20.86 TRINITY_DN34178_c0_g1_i1:172-663(+)